VGWTSGALFPAEAAAEATAEADQEAAAVHALRYAPGNPRVFFDVELDGQPAGRMEMQLFMHVAPRAAGNFLAMCRGDSGSAPAGGEGAGRRFSYEGALFYRVLDMFICQAGVYVPAVSGGAFDDDPGGLALKHTRAGLLSMANSGRNTNTNHFSILMAPAPHLDGAYTIFGEVVKGLAVARAINAFATPSGAPTKQAVIVRAGQLA
jgi:peptidyl-prolyl isomerase D